MVVQRQHIGLITLGRGSNPTTATKIIKALMITIKKIKATEQIPIGWRLGCVNKKMNGYRWITDGSKRKKLKAGEELPDGWGFLKN